MNIYQGKKNLWQKQFYLALAQKSIWATITKIHTHNILIYSKAKLIHSVKKNQTEKMKQANLRIHNISRVLENKTQSKYTYICSTKQKQVLLIITFFLILWFSSINCHWLLWANKFFLQICENKFNFWKISAVSHDYPCGERES